MAKDASKLDCVPKSPEDVWTSDTTTEFAGAGAAYSTLKAVGVAQEWWYGLKDSPRVNIEKPVLFVQGFVAPPGQFSVALEHLTADGQNGGGPVYIKEGKCFADVECQKSIDPSPDSKVFRMIHDPLAPPEVIADNMELATEAIAKLTDEQRPDVLAHSLGGLGARIYADRGNKLGKLAMVGTPNQGSRAALLTKAALVNGIGWATALAQVSPVAIPALEWMIPTVNGNQKLEDLNQRWEAQKTQTEGAIILGSDGHSSPSSVHESALGDGLIEASSLSVGDLEVKVIAGDESRKGHYSLVSDPDLFQAYSKFFGWKPATCTEF